MIFNTQGNYGRPNCIATLTGDGVVITGQKSAWVRTDDRRSLPAVLRGRQRVRGRTLAADAQSSFPWMQRAGLEAGLSTSFGQRALNQGRDLLRQCETFEESRPRGPDQYQDAVYAVHTFANALMGTVFTGLCPRRL